MMATYNLSLISLLRENASFRAFAFIRAADELAVQILNVAVGWNVYVATHDPMSLAFVGLAQFIPNAAMALVAGHSADRLDRRKLVAASLLLQTVCLAVFSLWLATRIPSAKPVYFLLVILGFARAFYSPAMSAMLPNVVEGQAFSSAVAASSSILQVCTLVGPAVGGILYAVGGSFTFGVAAALCLFAAVATRSLVCAKPVLVNSEAPRPKESIFAGLHYIRSNRLLLSLISLDLFAVLLGGVSALLPIYAKDILHVGPVGLGCLRCAPGAGAALVGLLLVRRPIKSAAGIRMLACVAGFGLATIVFAISKNVWVSLFALALAGGFDMVSMVIRHTLVQTATPDAMRGRVSAVNFLFIGASAELGEFESGLTAALFGTIPSALLGGVGTLATVALWVRLFPELRAANNPSLAERQANAAESDSPAAVASGNSLSLC